MTESLEAVMSALYGPYPSEQGDEDGSWSNAAKRLLFSMGYTYFWIVLVIMNVGLLAWVRVFSFSDFSFFSCNGLGLLVIWREKNFLCLRICTFTDRVSL